MEHVIPELDRAGLRKFAIMTGAIVAVLFGLFFPWVFELNWPLWPWIFFAVLSLWGIVLPQSLRPVYYWWMRLGLLLNKITTPIIMGVVFFLVLLPTGFFMRFLLRRDPMARSYDESADSYRIESGAIPPDNLTRPF